MVTVYYIKRIKIRISNGKRYLEQCLGDSWQKFTVVLSQQLWGQCLILPAMMYDSMPGVLPTRDVHLNLGVQCFSWLVT